MQAVILAGGLGTRLSEETHLKPKPMVEIGGMPIIWHIMKIYSSYGIDEFLICCGYKGYMIKEYFANYVLHTNDVTINMKNDSIKVHSPKKDSWKVTLVDTGSETMTGGRIKKIKEYLEEDTFLLTYGDGLADVNINSLIKSHNNSGKSVTVTAVKPPGRFGSLVISEDNNVLRFQEKIDGENSWINGGFFVINKKVIDRIDDNAIWEKEPLESLAKDNELNAYKHYGFWRPMDTLGDKKNLEKFWDSNNAPWKIW